MRNRARLRYTVEQKFGKGVVSKILTNRLSPTGRNIGSLSAKAGQKRKQPGSRWQPSKRGKFIPPSKRGKFAPSSRAQESRKGFERRGNQRGGDVVFNIFFYFLEIFSSTKTPLFLIIQNLKLILNSLHICSH